MAVEETKHDLLMRRTQLVIAILVGITGLVLGVYNIKKNILSKQEPPAQPTIVVQQAPQAQAPAPGGQIRSALDEVGSEWIKKLGKVKSESPQ